MVVSIRPAKVSDAPALNHICLHTGQAGTTAEHLHTLPEVLGLIYAEPYVNVDSTWGFVLVDSDDENGEKVVGYIIGAIDTASFERSAEETWWPALRAKYAPYLSAKASSTDTSITPALTEADIRCIRRFLSPPTASPACIAYSPAHLHIDILPEYQRRGFGKQLISRAVLHLSHAGLRGVWLEMDTRNISAGTFYERLGFSKFEGASEGAFGLQFSDWRG